MDDQSRNLILATALSFLVILGWFVLGPILFPERLPAAGEQTAPAAPAGQTAGEPTTAAPPAAGTVAQAPELAAAAAEAATPRWRGPQRVPIRTARLEGSLSLIGGRIDDLKLTNYTVSLDPGLADRHPAEPGGCRGAPIIRSSAGRRPGALAADAVPGAEHALADRDPAAR